MFHSLLLSICSNLPVLLSALFAWSTSTLFPWLARFFFALVLLDQLEEQFHRIESGHEDAPSWIRLLVAYEILSPWLGGPTMLAVILTLNLIQKSQLVQRVRLTVASFLSKKGRLR